MPAKFKSPEQIFEEQEEKENQVDELIEGKKQEEEKPTIKKLMKRLDLIELKSEILNHQAFCIGTKDKIKGQILFVNKAQKQKFVLVRVVTGVDETGEFKHYYLFNEPISKKDERFRKEEITAEFYLYQLVTEKKTYQLFSTEELNLGEYNIWGTIIESLDYVNTGNYSKIPTKLPYLFVHTAFERTNQIQDHNEFFERFEKYNLTEKKLIDWIYTSPSGWLFEFPKSFCYIQIANLLACKDEFNNFHLPALIIGETGTAKTTATELIFNKMNELRGYVDMTSCRGKGLTPSFASASNVKMGLLLEARRYVPVDEFFRGLIEMHNEDREKVMECIKNLLDYSKREHASGHADATSQMRAEHIALTNPKSYGNNILQLSKYFEPENLTRYLIWYIPVVQKEFIKGKKKNRIRGDYSYISNDDFLAGIEYLKTFNCEYDKEKVSEIYEIGEKFLSSKGDEYDKVRALYSSRYFEHACKLIDSLTKLRCWVEGDKEFKAQARDYDLIKSLWLEMLENWKMDFLIIEHQKV